MEFRNYKSNFVRYYDISIIMAFKADHTILKEVEKYNNKN